MRFCCTAGGRHGKQGDYTSRMTSLFLAPPPPTTPALELSLFLIFVFFFSCSVTPPPPSFPSPHHTPPPQLPYTKRNKQLQRCLPSSGPQHEPGGACAACQCTKKEAPPPPPPKLSSAGSNRVRGVLLLPAATLLPRTTKTHLCLSQTVLHPLTNEVPHSRCIDLHNWPHRHPSQAPHHPIPLAFTPPPFSYPRRPGRTHCLRSISHPPRLDSQMLTAQRRR